MAFRKFSMLVTGVGIVGFAAGCGSRPAPPTPAQAAAAAQQSNRAQQQQIQAVQNNTNMSDAQKANAIAILSRPRGMADRVHGR